MNTTVRRIALMLAPAALGLAVIGGSAASDASAGSSALIVAVGAENEYADVIGQIGGQYVKATAIENNPSVDPHSFEASPSIARLVSAARIVVQNGIGYDSYMTNIENASPNHARRVIDVQKLLGLPDSTPNPHLWYKPTTMPAVAKAIAGDLSAIQPAHAAYFRTNLAKFDQSLTPWDRALKAFATRYPKTPVATTEPVGDYMLDAAGAVNLTPYTFQADVMNGIDPAPQDVTLQNSLFSQRRVRVFLYNRQVTDTLTESFLAAATKYGIPVVGLYETMPTGYHYQSWMLAEVNALTNAVAHKTSTEKL